MHSPGPDLCGNGGGPEPLHQLRTDSVPGALCGGDAAGLHHFLAGHQQPQNGVCGAAGSGCVEDPCVYVLLPGTVLAVSAGLRAGAAGAVPRFAGVDGASADHQHLPWLLSLWYRHFRCCSGKNQPDEPAVRAGISQNTEENAPSLRMGHSLR